MNIDVYRHAGFMGRSVPLDVLLDGRKVASVNVNQTLSVSLPDGGATLQVSMQGAVFSPPVKVTPSDARQRFECGTPLWVLLDFLSLCYMPPLKQRVFYIRRVANA